jgi:hypothetical protein
VTDPNFSESFIAIPDSGWYFQKWNSGDGFFCGGSNEPTCTLSFKGSEDSKAVEDMVASSEVFYIMPVFKQLPDTITVDGKQWYQPYFFTGLSWDDINAVCPAGECAGVLNGYDMNGWTWASIEDVNALFNYYLGGELTPQSCTLSGSKPLGPGPDGCVEDSENAWASAFYSDGWRPIPTYRSLFSRGVTGWMRDLSKSGEIYSGGIYGGINTPAGIFDAAYTDYPSSLVPFVDAEVGGWFYRTP